MGKCNCRRWVRVIDVGQSRACRVAQETGLQDHEAGDAMLVLAQPISNLGQKRSRSGALGAEAGGNIVIESWGAAKL